MELDLKDLHKICKPENIHITVHAAKRLEQREIKLVDVINCIIHGEIIEQYPTDYPYPSCLLLGFNVEGNYLHAVVASDGLHIWIVTAYKPDPEKWSSDFKQRKGN